MKKKRLQRSDSLWLTAVALLVLLQFWWLPGNPGTPDDTYSNTIEGKRGFFQTLETLSEAGMLPTVRRETERLVPDRRCTLVIVSPDRYPDEHEQQALSQFVLGGGSLVFAPNWTATDCSMPTLHIETEHKYLADEDTLHSVTSAPVPAPNTTTQGENEATPKLTAEAEEETPRAEAEVAKRTAPATVPSDATSEEELEGEPEEVKERMKQQMSVNSPTGEDSDFSDIASISATSPLVNGGIVWHTRGDAGQSPQKDSPGSVDVGYDAGGVVGIRSRTGSAECQPRCFFQQLYAGSGPC